MSESTQTALIAIFGIAAIIATIAGFHVRDSVCFSACRGVILACSRSSTLTRGPEVDIEAQAESMSSGIIRDDAVFELQPMLSLPLYYESPTDEVRTMAGLDN
ncbi:hypothetical protein BKA58DRAFT_399753 [Alternaria rosae]|uniref:uncharacterized protein n=1 Tax=Alternaria rosae TaxID=1187941 RepID=UPI001E8CD776|nr:uncharacterized protein BKA58DRAFT_399753 [Alternaria rosae]KAH6875558.1 hypothetical protein BKA58DRAFT_399753 [Alternaria rosae]